MKSNLKSLIAGRKALFVDGIRADQMSGGRSSTNNIFEFLSHSCELVRINTSPSGGKFRISLYLILMLPAPVFVLIKKIVPNVWCEFFSRLSPIMLISFLIMYLWHKPSIVILNHHSTFYLSKFVKFSKVIFIWHDVPSSKKIFPALDFYRLDKRICTGIQEFFTRKKNSEHLVFSFTDQKIMRRLHGVYASLLPVYVKTPPKAERKIIPHSWLLVGNWDRSENREGAEVFFQECAKLITINSYSIAKFNIAGFGADHFMRDLIARRPELKCLYLTATQNYPDLSIFHDVALLAPLLSGAGIKVKTIEAWSFGIPVIGTSQAFSGLPAHLWKKGGLMVESLSDMAEICLDQIELQQQIAHLDPYEAFAVYQHDVNA